jgi:hypothetical protein
MRKIWISLSTLLFLCKSFSLYAQNDSLKTAPKKEEIQAVYQHYLQDGIHSAVTGGEGTEKLQVYAPELYWKTENNRRIWQARAGVDVISSASTDNIDFVTSSASRLDARVHAQVQTGWKTADEKHRFLVGAGASLESDYFSRSLLAGWNIQTPTGFEAGLEASWFYDDLRWGRVNPGLYKPDRLIYPSELRYKNWLDDFIRQSFNLRGRIEWLVSRRHRLALYPEWGYQKGQLATPFHRVFFQDQSLGVERLPGHRQKLALAMQWNAFIGGRWIFKTKIQGYSDDFGIRSLMGEEEILYIWQAEWRTGISFRTYAQSAAKAFAAKGQHAPDKAFATSDYDLSAFTSWEPGWTVVWRPLPEKPSGWHWKEIRLRGSGYFRSDGLKALMLSLNLSLYKEQSGKPF